MEQFQCNYLIAVQMVHDDNKVHCKRRQVQQSVKSPLFVSSALIVAVPPHMFWQCEAVVGYHGPMKDPRWK